MKGLCLEFTLPLCDRHGSYAVLVVDWVPLKVRMKALVGRHRGLQKGDVKGEEMKRRMETA